MTREHWSAAADLWTKRDHEIIKRLGQSIVRAHRKYSAIARSINEPDMIWSQVATKATCHSLGPRFFFNPNKRSIRVSEDEGGSSTLKLPEALSRPPDIDAMIEALPNLDG